MSVKKKDAFCHLVHLNDKNYSAFNIIYRANENTNYIKFIFFELQEQSK